MPQVLHTQPISDEAAAEVQEREERWLRSNSVLDAAISGALDKAEKIDEFEDFVSAREHRKELAERHGTDTAGIVDKFSYYNNELKKHGEIGAELIRGDYFANTNLAKLLHVQKQEQAKPETKTDNENVHEFVKLDRIIDHALDETDQRESDKKEFEAAKEKFAALKADNPDLTWKEFFEATVHTDRELWRDPNFANRLAAASGVPATPLQVEFANVKAADAEQFNAANGLLAQMSSNGEIVDFQRHAPAMAKIMQDPNFVPSDDIRMDIRRANRIAELQEIERLRGIEQTTAVEKAKRAAPVKSAGGNRTAATAPRDSLDKLIDSATAHLSGD